MHGLQDARNVFAERLQLTFEAPPLEVKRTHKKETQKPELTEVQVYPIKIREIA